MSADFFTTASKLSSDNIADLAYNRRRRYVASQAEQTDISFRDMLRRRQLAADSKPADVSEKPSVSAVKNALSPSVKPVPQDGIKINVDLNNDGVVNVMDLNIQLANFGSDDAKFDHNHDGVSDGKDIDVLLSFWGMEGQMIIENPDIDNDGTVTASDLGLLLANYGSNSDAHDLNNDGTVDQSDLDLLLAFWGQNIA